MQRVESSAQAAQWDCGNYLEKLKAWSGDLSQPELGLTAAQWQSLQEVDAIIHNGASIQWNADYHTLKHSNVMSTMELLKVSMRSKHRPAFVYVSGGRYFDESMGNAEIAQLLASAEGYSQTKFVAEMLVKKCMEGTKQHHYSIVRPGLIIGTAQEGVASTNDFLWRIAAGAVRVQGYPTPGEHRSWLSVSSSDRVARAVVMASSSCLDDDNDDDHKSHDEPIVNISDGIPLKDFWAIVNQTLKINMQPLSYEEWIDKVQKDVEVTRESHPLWPVMHMLGKDLMASVRPISSSVSSLSPSSSSSSSPPPPEVPGEEIPKKKEEEEVKLAVKKNVEYLAGIGFFTGTTGTENEKSRMEVRFK